MWYNITFIDIKILHQQTLKGQDTRCMLIVIITSNWKLDIGEFSTFIFIKLMFYFHNKVKFPIYM